MSYLTETLIIIRLTECLSSVPDMLYDIDFTMFYSVYCIIKILPFRTTYRHLKNHILTSVKRKNAFFQILPLRTYT